MIISGMIFIVVYIASCSNYLKLFEQFSMCDEYLNGTNVDELMPESCSRELLERQVRTMSEEANAKKLAIDAEQEWSSSIIKASQIADRNTNILNFRAKSHSSDLLNIEEKNNSWTDKLDNQQTLHQQEMAAEEVKYSSLIQKLEQEKIENAKKFQELQAANATAFQELHYVQKTALAAKMAEQETVHAAKVVEQNKMHSAKMAEQEKMHSAKMSDSVTFMPEGGVDGWIDKHISKFSENGTQGLIDRSAVSDYAKSITNMRQLYLAAVLAGTAELEGKRGANPKISDKMYSDDCPINTYGSNPTCTPCGKDEITLEKMHNPWNSTELYFNYGGAQDKSACKPIKNYVGYAENGIWKGLGLPGVYLTREQYELLANPA